MAQQRIDKKSEAFTILQENLASARDRDMSADDVEKAIRGNKNLLKIYKEIEASLKKSTDTYRQNRKSLEQINELNRETFKILKADSITRGKLNQINRLNVKYLDEAHDLTRDSFKNDVDSKKIREKILTINNAIIKSEREKVQESEKYSDTFRNIAEFVSKNKNKFNIGEQKVKHYIEQIEDSENEFRQAMLKVANANDTVTKDVYSRQAEKIKSEQNRYIRELFDSVEVKNASGKVVKKVGNQIKTELSSFLGEALQSSNIINSLSLSNNIAKKVANELERAKKNAQVIETHIGKVGKIFDGLGKTPLSSLVNFDKAKNSYAESSKAGKSGFGSGVQALAGATPIGQAGIIGGGFMIAKYIVEMMAKADDRVTKIARSFGIAKSEAGGIYDNTEGINTELGQVGLNIDDIIDAQINFNTRFGYAVNLSDEMLKNIAQATKSIGLSSEATNELIQQSLVSNREINDVEADILGQLSYQSKGLLGNKVMLEKVLHISGEVRANFKGNVDEITKSIVKAQQYGTTLEKVNQIGEGLLDWESSISAELEAELITGRQINLEKARYASLMGQTAILMEEINKNVGDFDQFSNMNVLQQQSFAKALGMTREEMSKMLFEQQINAKIISLGGKEFREDQRTFLSQSDKFKKEYNEIMNNGTLNEAEKMKKLGEIVRNNISQLTAQAKFESVLEKIKEKIAQIFGDGAVLDKIADGLIDFMATFKIIGKDDQKQYLAEKIAKATKPNLSSDTPEYKTFVAGLKEYDKSTLQAKVEIIKIDPKLNPNSPEYENAKQKGIKNGQSFYEPGIIGAVTGTFESAMITRMDEFIKGQKELANRPTVTKYDNVPASESANKNGLNPKVK